MKTKFLEALHTFAITFLAGLFYTLLTALTAGLVAWVILPN